MSILDNYNLNNNILNIKPDSLYDSIVKSSNITEYITNFIINNQNASIFIFNNIQVLNTIFNNPPENFIIQILQFIQLNILDILKRIGFFDFIMLIINAYWNYFVLIINNLYTENKLYAILVCIALVVGVTIFIVSYVCIQIFCFVSGLMTMYRYITRYCK
jgi:hypothetical protein